MLHEFIRRNRDEIVARTRIKEAARPARRPSTELTDGIPLLLDQLAARLRGEPPSAELGTSATAHGKNMLRDGFRVVQIVQGYSDVCDAVTELVIEQSAPITTTELQRLHQCLDVATTDAITEYERERDRAVTDQGIERLGFLAHELGNHLGSAQLSFDIIKRGTVGIGGSVGTVLGQSLSALRDLVDRSLAEVRLEARLGQWQRLPIQELIEEVEVVATFEARARGVELTVTSDCTAEVEVDRHLVASAVGNLLQNAFKFTQPKSRVSLTTQLADDRVLIEIEDECGGLSAGVVESLFEPFEQRGADRSGLGLGLAISRRGVEANGGEIRVRNLPGKGCIFTIDLPRASGF